MRTTLSIMAIAVACVGGPPVRGADSPGVARSIVPQGDLRAYMHGIGAASGANGLTYVFFSSSGLPPRGAGPDGNWTHDVYVARWSSTQPRLGIPRIFISNPEAQEPVSIAQNDAGNIMVTFEDG